MVENTDILLHHEYLDHPVRRTAEPPQRLQQVIDELGQGRTGTLISGPKNGLPEHLSIAFRSGRWWSDPDLAAGEGLQFRDLEACLLDSGRPFGAMIFREARFLTFLDSSDLLMSFDDHSSEWHHASEVLFRHWSMDDLSVADQEWFHLVIFSALWVHPKAQQNAWRAPALHLIQRRYRSRAHLMLLKPFPLEYEGAGKARGAAERAQDRRTMAMVRLYNRSLGAQLLEDPDQDEPWMYVPFHADLPEPSLYDPDDI